MLRLSYSSLSDWQLCPRRWAYRYIERKERHGHRGRPLAFGTAFHRAQAVLWSWAGDADDPRRLADAMAEWSRAAAEEQLSFEDTLIGEVLLIGYAARWDDMRLGFHGPPAVEVKVVSPVLDPSGNPDPELEIAAVFDVIATDIDGSTVITEHKTTTSEIAPGAAYWPKLDQNLQASIYWLAASDAGLHVGHVQWDAIRAPNWKRLEATPADKRELYKRATKQADGTVAQPGDPKPGVRLLDETADEFAARVMDRVLSDPNAFYGRQSLHRDEDELGRVRADLWQAGRQMLHAVEVGAFPRNLNSCRAFNSECPYLPVCRGETTIDDPRVYKIRQRPEVKEPF